MQIISHRGLWYDFYSENNKEIAFKRSFDLGIGTETDLRDVCGKIVISHDMPTGDEITFEKLLQLLDGKNLPLGLNIKADGMGDEILHLLKKYNHTNYFTFDMSIPEMVYEMKTELKVYAGYSDILPAPVLLDKACGVWLDSFNSEWFTEKTLISLLDKKKKICIVSSDLHNRDIDRQWTMLKNSSVLTNDDIMLCTNYPEKAIDFFGLKK